jgi:hypothetical protein
MTDLILFVKFVKQFEEGVKHRCTFFFFFFLLLLLLFTRARPLMPRKHRSLKAYCAPQIQCQHRFSSPVTLIKGHRSLTEAVLISFGSTNGFPKTL